MRNEFQLSHAVRIKVGLVNGRMELEISWAWWWNDVLGTVRYEIGGQLDLDTVCDI